MGLVVSSKACLDHDYEVLWNVVLLCLHSFVERRSAESTRLEKKYVLVRTRACDRQRPVLPQDLEIGRQRHTIVSATRSVAQESHMESISNAAGRPR